MKRRQVVTTARGRLQDILKDLAAPEEEEVPDVKNKGIIVPARGRPRKNARSTKEKVFLMKLFDRTVNLGKFDDSTPLYPICRAWLYNNKKTDPIEELVSGPSYYSGREKLVKVVAAGKTQKVTSLPPPHEVNVDRIPVIAQPKRIKAKINLDYDIDNPPISKEKLMKDYLQRWTKVKKSWLEQSAQYAHDRYGESLAVLDMLSK